MKPHRPPALSKTALRRRRYRERRDGPGTRRQSTDDLIEVVVIDEQPAVRSGVEALLAGEAGITVIAAISTSFEALDLVHDRQPAVCLISAGENGRGLKLARQLKQLRNPPGVLVWGPWPGAELVGPAIVAGADGAIANATSGEELAEVIRQIAAGQRLFSALTPSGTRQLAAKIHAEDRPIMTMLIHGTEPDDVARVLGISGRWLDARRWAILQQLLDDDTNWEPGRVGRMRSSRRGAPGALSGSRVPEL